MAVHIAVGSKSILHRLERIGNPRQTCFWPKGRPDYVYDLQLNRQDAPELIRIARTWVTRTDWPDDEDDMTIYAPIHAWRALAQLRAVEAIDLLLEMLPEMDERGDDWHLEEFPHAFALIGPAALDPLIAFANDPEVAEFALICATHAISEVAKRHGDVSQQVVLELTRLLQHYRENTDTVNAFLMRYLMDLQATDAAELIERVYADEHVDESVNGNWATVREELGVPGLGLVPEDRARRPIDLFGSSSRLMDIGDVPSGTKKRTYRKRKRKSR